LTLAIYIKVKKDTKFSVVRRPCPCNEKMRKISKQDSETHEKKQSYAAE
jgi:hypothetical protein